jgi:hypothetical protein
MTTDELKARLNEGYSATELAIASIRSDFRRVLRLLEERDLLDQEALRRFRRAKTRIVKRTPTSSTTRQNRLK